MLAPSRKRPWSRPLADLVGTVIDPVLARQGFGESDIILHWDDIVGARLAAVSRPLELKWPPRGTGRRANVSPQPATLIVRVDGAFALELQHTAEQVLARINAHLGWRCVGKLAFRQGPIEAAVAHSSRRAQPTSASLRTASERMHGIEVAGLRDALARLGAHVGAASQPTTDPAGAARGPGISES